MPSPAAHATLPLPPPASAETDLARPLPEALAGRAHGWLTDYRRWPVFSPAWVRGRARSVGLLITVLYLLTMSAALTGAAPKAPLGGFVQLTITLLVPLLAGPWLGSLARRRALARGLGLRAELAAVAGALAAVVLAVAAFNHWGAEPMKQGIAEWTGMVDETGQRRRVTLSIGIFIRGRDMGSVVADMKQRVDKNVQIPHGYTLNWSGEFENQERAMKRLSLVVPLSLALIFVLLFDAFKSLKAALLILVNVPLALIGGFVALYVFHIPLSVSAAIGFIALSGQAVLNGVVMLAGFQQLRAHGMGLMEAITEGAMQRLRTVLMTALLAALGLLPMALSTAIGAETQRPLAIVVIGGLASATLLTLIVLPVLYAMLFGRSSTAQGSPATHAA